MNSEQRVRQGYASAKAVTKHHAKSFFFASLALFGARRRAAFALYAFCRRLDDLVDEGPREGLSERLTKARTTVAALYSGASLDVADWAPGELEALHDTVSRFAIPQQPFQDLLSGLEMDLTKTRYASFDELDLYCYRVAGTVGLLLTPVLGFRDERALGPAVELGKAMQLTNILRDVREDLGRGRVYLPQDELAAFGVTEQALATGTIDARFIELMRFQISRARELYAKAAQGVPYLTGFGSRPTVRVMGAVYGAILNVIEARHFDIFSARASVSLPRKFWLAAGATTGISMFEGQPPRLLSDKAGA